MPAPIRGRPEDWSGPQLRRRPRITSITSREYRSRPTPTRRSRKLAEIHGAALAHQFDDPEQQVEASTLGMWTFLATEILFFGGLFVAYLIYRLSYPQAFAAASHHLDIVLGTINTGVLIGSSLTMVLAVYSAQMGRRR